MAIALAIAPALIAVPATPANACSRGFLARIFRRSACSNAGNRSRGGAIRDEACSPGESIGEITHRGNRQIVALAPPGSLSKTVRKRPDIFLHVPFDRQINAGNSRLVLLFELATQDLKVSDQLWSSVSDDGGGGARTVIAQKVFSLPSASGLVQLPFPAEAPLVPNKPYVWNVRLLCQTRQSLTTPPEDIASLTERPIAPATIAPATTTAVAPNSLTTSSLGGPAVDASDLAILTLEGDRTQPAESPALVETVYQELYGQIRRDQLADLPATLSLTPTAQSEAYLAEGAGFDAVSVLATERPTNWSQQIETILLDPIDDTSLEGAIQLLVPAPPF